MLDFYLAPKLRQKSLHWQHPGTNSLPRQEVAWSVLPGLIPELILLAQSEESSLALGKYFHSVFVASHSRSASHSFSVSDLRKLTLQAGDAPGLPGV